MPRFRITEVVSLRRVKKPQFLHCSSGAPTYKSPPFTFSLQTQSHSPFQSCSIPFQSRGILIDNHHLQPALRRSNRRTEAGPGVRAEADRVAPEKRENGGRMSRGSRRQRPWWTPVSPATAVADCGEETSSQG
ncbi:hypothetical protein DEO72_LG11g1298 [Vigna unguiculata]|uniref:Uncharacterized protein n=1 Tax=Vigna unguiculata TaxID=3917 RepID=A0A4D6NP36_VIGUN|nr:hypothetical protein DEO72_LG11g1298 [Vigna unguiculata]